MSILSNKKLYYSYWDIYGHGINPQHLSNYSETPIFDSYNRTIFAGGGTFGNHQLGTYHGEIFNDFGSNNAKGDYSSAFGTHTTSYNLAEHGVGHYNLSKKDVTLFTVGNGSNGNPRNAFEIHYDDSAHIAGSSYVSKSSYVDGNSYIGANEYVAGHAVVSKSMRVKGNSYIEGSAYVSQHLEVNNGVDIAGMAYMNSGSYTSGEAYVNGSLYVNGLDVENAYTYTLGYMGSYVGESLKNVVKTFGQGQYYVWVGKTVELPAEEDRYDNVIYVALNDMPSTGNWYVDTNFGSLLYADNALSGGSGTFIVTADDSDSNPTNDRVLQHNGLQSDVYR